MRGDRELPAPPVGEDIHLPGPSLLPILTAVGLTLIVVGTTLGVIFFATGVIVFLVCTVMWIRDARREFDELPPEHGH